MGPYVHSTTKLVRLALRPYNAAVLRHMERCTRRRAATSFQGEDNWPNSQMEILIPIAFVVCFPILWCGACLLLSHIGGWAGLATRYRDGENAAGQSRYLCSGRIGMVNYNSCLTLGVSKTGLRLAVLFPFRVGHRPIFIPWSDFHSVAQRRILFMPFLQAEIGKPAIATVMLPTWLEAYIPNSDASR